MRIGPHRILRFNDSRRTDIDRCFPFEYGICRVHIDRKRTEHIDTDHLHQAVTIEIAVIGSRVDAHILTADRTVRDRDLRYALRDLMGRRLVRAESVRLRELACVKLLPIRRFRCDRDIACRINDTLVRYRCLYRIVVRGRFLIARDTQYRLGKLLILLVAHIGICRQHDITAVRLRYRQVLTAVEHRIIRLARIDKTRKVDIARLELCRRIDRNRRCLHTDTVRRIDTAFDHDLARRTERDIHLRHILFFRSEIIAIYLPFIIIDELFIVIFVRRKERERARVDDTARSDSDPFLAEEKEIPADLIVLYRIDRTVDIDLAVNEVIEIQLAVVCLRPKIEIGDLVRAETELTEPVDRAVAEIFM